VKNNLEQAEERAEKKARKREKKKKPKMKVSGRSVFGLKKMMTRKKNNS